MPRVRYGVKQKFGMRKNPHGSRGEVKSIHYIICEGKTEEQYFIELGRRKEEVGIDEIIGVAVLERIEGKSISNAKRILSDLFNYEENFENSISNMLSEREIKVQDIDSDIDSVWMVFDTETNHDIHKQLLWVKKQCIKIGWNLILTNPEFEFWLLMHVTDVSNYEDKLIRSNKKVRSKRTFLSKELSNILPDGYKKSNIRPKRFIDNINFAIEQAIKYFSGSLDDVLDDIGTNIHVMIQKMKNT